MNRNEMRSTLDEESVRLSKALGQNLLHDQNVLRRIAKSADLQPADQVAGRLEQVAKYVVGVKAQQGIAIEQNGGDATDNDGIECDGAGGARRSWISRMYEDQAGAASRPPCAFALILVGWSNPTHTAVTISGVKPTNHASENASVVPVLPAAGWSGIWARVPVPRMTFCSSTWVARQATWVLTTRSPEGVCS